MRAAHLLPPPGTLACLYGRRSKDEGQEDSLDVQHNGGTAFCAEQQYRVVLEIADDGISRAEFVKRHGLNKLVAAAKRGEFKVLIVRDSSRLGGDMVRTAALLQELRECGCQVVYYRTKQVVELATAQDRLIVHVLGYKDESERETTSDRTREHLQDKAKQGRATCGAPYGYQTIDKQFVVREDEALIVRRIFSSYAKGAGLREITHELNAQHIAPPNRRGEQSAALWSRQTVRGLLTRERYIGRFVRGKTQDMYRGGTKVRVRLDASEHVVNPIPAIISQDLWDAVAARLARNPRYGNAISRKGHAPKYLLVGLARCATCGGPIYGSKRIYRSKRNNLSYICGRYRDHGKAACTNNAIVDMQGVDGQLALAVQNALNPSVVSSCFGILREILAKRIDKAPDERAVLELEVKKLKQELARLATVAAATDSAEAVVAAIVERNARLKVAEQQLAVAPAAAELALSSLDELEAIAQAQVTQLVDAFSTEPQLARKVLQTLLVGPMQLSREGLTAQVSPVALLGDPDCDARRPAKSTDGKGLWAVISPEDVPVVQLRVRLAA